MNIRARWLAAATMLLAGAALASYDDYPPPGGPKPSVSIGDAMAYESAGRIAFPVTLDRPAKRAVRVKAITVAGTAMPGKDFLAGIVSTRIPAGATGGTLDVPIFADGRVGPDVRFIFAWSPPSEQNRPKTWRQGPFATRIR